MSNDQYCFECRKQAYFKCLRCVENTCLDCLKNHYKPEWSKMGTVMMTDWNYTCPGDKEEKEEEEIK